MPEPPRNAFQYAIVRVVPRVERGECLNVGVILLCRPQRFLGARIALDERRLAAFAPDLDPPRSGRTSTPSSGSPRATRRPDRSPGSGPPSGSTGWSLRRARSSRRPRSIPGCATTLRPSSTTSWRRWSTSRPGHSSAGGPRPRRARPRGTPCGPGSRPRRTARSRRCGRGRRYRRGMPGRGARRGHGRAPSGLGQQDPEAGGADADRPVRLAGLAPDGVGQPMRGLVDRDALERAAELDQQDRGRPAVASVARPLVTERGGPIGSSVELDRAPFAGDRRRAAPGRRVRSVDERLDPLSRPVIDLLVVVVLRQHEFPRPARARWLGLRDRRGEVCGIGHVRQV